MTDIIVEESKKSYYNEACNLYRESMEILKKIVYFGDIVWIHHNMAEIEMKKENCTKAVNLYLEGFRPYRKIDLINKP